MRRRGLLTPTLATPLVVVVAMLAGCGGNDDEPADADQVAAADDGSVLIDGSGDTNTDDEAADDADSTEVAPDALIPVAIGNSWTYRIDYPDPVGTVTQTQEITAVEPSGDGTDVTFANDFHYEDGSQEDFAIDLVYTFHPDGSMSVPYNSFAIGDTQLTSSGTDGIVWPSYADLTAGATYEGEGDATGSLTAPGMGTVKATYSYSTRSAGTQAVSVPTGSSPDAAVMDVDLDITVTDSPAGPIDVPVTLRIWFVEGVGIVKQKVGGDFMPGTAIDLVDTNLTP